MGGKNLQQVQKRDKTLKISFIFAAVPPHPNPPPPGGRERLLIIMLLINNMQMWVIGCLHPARPGRVFVAFMPGGRSSLATRTLTEGFEASDGETSLGSGAVARE